MAYRYFLKSTGVLILYIVSETLNLKIWYLSKRNGRQGQDPDMASYSNTEDCVYKNNPPLTSLTVRTGCNHSLQGQIQHECIDPLQDPHQAVATCLFPRLNTWVSLFLM